MNVFFSLIEYGVVASPHCRNQKGNESSCDNKLLPITVSEWCMTVSNHRLVKISLQGLAD